MAMQRRKLTSRELNRTLLSRQLLLERHRIAIPITIENLVGLQAQIPNPPYIGLWTRLVDFQRDDLTGLMEERRVVRAAMMRSTLHLMTAADHQRFRPVLQPALSRALNAFYGKRARGLNIEKLVVAAKPFLEEAPRTTGDIKQFLLTIEPERDGDAMAYAVRNHLPQVQVPPGGTWGTGSKASYVMADSWLNDDTPPEDLRSLFFRYLAACGPASIMDFQFWTGMVRLKDEIESLRSELVAYKDENGIELFDLPEMSILDEDMSAPIRFIPEYDNLVISHNDRSRILPDQHYRKVFLSAARVLGTILIDGFVAATWKIQRKRKAYTLLISPFDKLSTENQTLIEDEGQRLLDFVADDAQTRDIQIDTL